MSKKNTSGSVNKLSIVGIAILAIVAIALSIFAVTQNNTAAETTPDYTFTPDSDIENGDQDNGEGEEESGSDSDQEPKPEPGRFKPTGPIEVERANIFVAIGENDQLIRGEFGSCEGEPGWAEVSIDGGYYWELSNTAVQEAHELLGASYGSAGYVELSTLDVLCDPFLVRSYASGYSWQYAPQEIYSRWFFNPHNPGVLNTPLGEVAAPCDIVQLSVTNEYTNAGVLCKDMTVMTSADDGQTWSTGLSVPGAASIAVRDTDVLVATANQGECVGIQMQLIDGEGATDIGTCVDLPTEGQGIALAAYGNELALWAGDTFLRSVDGGVTWA